MLPDYHFHTEFSGDSAAPAREQVLRAIDLGMEALCVTDHHDYDVESPIDFTLDTDRYLPAMMDLKEEFKDRIDLRIGIELGLQVHLKKYFNDLLKQYPFDYVIGSTHFIDRKDPAYPEFFAGRDESQAYSEYFQTTLDNVSALDCFDAAGHIDYIVRYGPNQAKYYTYEAYEEILEKILKTLISRGKGIECNTAGFRKGIGMPNPRPEILRRYRELGGEIITIGSDAHIPEDLGADFEQARLLLLSCGFTYYTTFKDRKPEWRKL